MARFDHTPEAQQTPNFTGASRGIHFDRDNSMATLFGGLADALGAGVQEADRQIQEGIQSDIFDQVDAIQDEFGVGDATDFQSDAESSDPTPAGLQRAGDQIQNLAAAFQRGNLRESHYWARLNSMVRQLRAKYPGYRPEIDQMVSSVTGARPANALRQALFREWGESGQEDEISKIEKQASFDNSVALPVDYWQRKGTPDAYTREEVLEYVGRQTKKRAELSYARDNMALLASQGQLTEKDAERGFRLEANQLVNTVLSDITGTVGKNYAEIETKLLEAQRAKKAGRPVDQQELEGLRGALGELKVALQQQLHMAGINPWDDSPEHSYAAFLDPQTRQNVIEDAMTRVRILEDALDGENFEGVFGYVAADIAARETDEGRRILENIPGAQTLRSMVQLFGSDIMGLYLSLNEDIQNSLTRALKGYEDMRAAGGEGSVGEAFQRGEETNRDADYYKGIMNQWIKHAEQGLQGPLPIEMFKNHAKYMFSQGPDNVLSRLNDASKFEYYSQVTSPEVTKAMIELRDAGDTQTWQMYERWVVNGFHTLFSQNVQDLQQLSVSRDYSVTWNDKHHRFEVDPGREIPGLGRMPLFMTGPLANVEALFHVPGYLKVEQLNSAIASLVPIIAEEGGDTAGELFSILSNLGYDPSEADTGGVVEKMIEGLYNFLRGKLDDLPSMPGMSFGAEAERRLGPDQRARGDARRAQETQ